ncbi:hypothetical protein sscle_09g069340 [Sclerotinia sclerotiorum 1980 UF-70]|uniref:C2H2-type domain-containing protein n=1 Tax=Sclerotinia sclerotiorum (strain ATCC 18683 / 1980 / Ss-1) TaxID=665079 RepID=A0A1D9QB23_SCLS1|nr:hypothetical protein sscle_09g069340 [Sclerotinia sclerotiorum 1980 UF-70]
MADSRFEAIFDEMDAPKLRELLKKLCNHGKFSAEDATGKIEVDGRDIIITSGFVDLTQSDDSDDSNFEDEKEGSEEESESGASNEEDEYHVRKLSKQQIRELISSKRKRGTKFKCENCEEDFDIKSNRKGDCWYHPGWKELDDESDFWADHDDRIHGSPEAFEDDPDYADEFKWDCCDKPGSDNGCKNTRHKVTEEVMENRVKY